MTGACSRLAGSRRRPRRGLSLLEVLVAVVIFLIAFAAMSELISQSARRAMLVEQREQAALKAESKLNEVLAGTVALSSEQGVPFEDDPEWLWSLDCEQNGQVTGLWNVRVRVHRADGNGGGVECVLSQMVLDPSLRGSTMDTATVAGTETTDTGTTTPTTGGTTAPATGGTAPAAPKGGGR